MGKRILFVDDEEDLVKMTCRMLRDEGFEVVSAFNGQDALNVLEKEGFDLIITDVLMPVIDGYELFKVIKANVKTAKIPVIILTARIMMDEAFLALGADAFIAKPFRFKQLMEKMEEVLGKHAAKAQGKVVFVMGSPLTQVQGIVVALNSQGCSAQAISNSNDLIPKTLEARPDVILIDVMTDDVPAAQTIQAMRCFTKLNDLPILTFSLAETDAEREEACRSAGATQHLGPINPDTPWEKLSDWL